MLGGIFAVACLVLLRAPGARWGVGLGMVALGSISAFVPRVRRLLPERTCQVAGGVVHGGLTRAATRWGFTLGLGYRTLLVTPYALTAAGVIVVHGRPLDSVILGMLYGALRGGVPAVTAMWRSYWFGGRSGDEPAVGTWQGRLRIPLALMSAAALIAAPRW